MSKLEETEAARRIHHCSMEALMLTYRSAAETMHRRAIDNAIKAYQYAYVSSLRSPRVPEYNLYNTNNT